MCDHRRRLWAYLVACADHDVRALEEVRDCGGVTVEQTLAGLGDTVAAPVDLHELGQLALRDALMTTRQDRESGAHVRILDSDKRVLHPIRRTSFR